MKVVIEKKKEISIEEALQRIAEGKGIILWLHDGEVRFVKTNSMAHNDIAKFYWVTPYVSNGRDRHSEFVENKIKLAVWIQNRISKGDSFYYFDTQAELLAFLARRQLCV